MQQFDLIVLGQGYAGLKAARLAVEKGLSVCAVEAMFPGGLVMSINELWPAPDGEVPSGPELTGELAMANMDNGIENVNATVSSLSRDGALWTVSTDAGDYAAPNVVIATGATLRKLGIPGEAEFQGRGVSACADCDGPLYMGKDAVVIGSGDSAYQEAVALTHYAGKVTLLMRGDAPKAQTRLVEDVAANGKVEVRPGVSPVEIVGDAAGVTGVKLDNGETVSCEVVFAFVGLDPQAGYLPADVAKDAVGGIVTDDRLATNVPGLWAIGAARSGFGGLLSDGNDDAARVVAAL